MRELLEKRSRELPAGTPPLPMAEVTRYLAELPGWFLEPDGRHIAKTYEFKNFHETMEFVNGLAFPLSRPLADTLGELQSFTPTIEALVVPDIDRSLDEQPAKTRFWNSFKPIGPWWAELPPY